MLGKRLPGVWAMGEFYDGVEQAVQIIFSRLAAQEASALEGLVDVQLLERLLASGSPSSGDADDAPAAPPGEAVASLLQPPSSEAEGWASPPELRTARVLGLVSAGGIIDDDKGRRIHVSPVIYSQEDYTYRGSRPVQLHRLQCWTLERGLQEGQQWRVVDIASGCWHWRRPRSPGEGEGKAPGG